MCSTARGVATSNAEQAREPEGYVLAVDLQIDTFTAACRCWISQILRFSRQIACNVAIISFRSEFLYLESLDFQFPSSATGKGGVVWVSHSLLFESAWASSSSLLSSTGTYFPRSLDHLRCDTVSTSAHFLGHNVSRTSFHTLMQASYSSLLSGLLLAPSQICAFNRPESACSPRLVANVTKRTDIASRCRGCIVLC